MRVRSSFADVVAAVWMTVLLVRDALTGFSGWSVFAVFVLVVALVELVKTMRARRMS